MQEFRISEYLSLRLENEHTIIYIKKMRFLQCKYLLMNIQTNKIQSLDEIESIDEASERLDKSQEGDGFKQVRIPPETEFWGHCSNLQVWFERNYDTRLLHTKLAFPLLKKLTEVGDPLALQVFKMEIINRYEKGTETNKTFLIAEGFLAYLQTDELLHLLLNQYNFISLIELSEEIELDNTFLSIKILLDRIKIENGRIIELDLSKLELIKFPICILKFNSLEVLDLGSNLLKEIPWGINKLKNLKRIFLSYNKLMYLPNSICSLDNLEQLWMDYNKIRWLPKTIGNLNNLEILSLYNNCLGSLPFSLNKLDHLKNLNIASNVLIRLPKKFSNLKALEKLSLTYNKKIEFENFFGEIVKLKRLKELRLKNLNESNLILKLKKKLEGKNVDVKLNL